MQLSWITSNTYLPEVIVSHSPTNYAILPRTRIPDFGVCKISMFMLTLLKPTLTRPVCTTVSVTVKRRCIQVSGMLTLKGWPHSWYGLGNIVKLISVIFLTQISHGLRPKIFLRSFHHVSGPFPGKGIFLPLFLRGIFMSPMFPYTTFVLTCGVSTKGNPTTPSKGTTATGRPVCTIVSRTVRRIPFQVT